MGRTEIKTFAMPRAAALLCGVLLLLGACSGEPSGDAGGDGGDPQGNAGTGAVARPTTVVQPETTAEGTTPRITLGEEPGDQPEAVLRLEGGRKTTFSGLCSVGDQQNVLSGKVPKRFAFDLNGSELSCRIEKRDEGRGALRVVLIAGDTTRSVQQTNSPGAAMNISYRGG